MLAEAARDWGFFAMLERPFFIVAERAGERGGEAGPLSKYL
jgi:hypothetical protein